MKKTIFIAPLLLFLASCNLSGVETPIVDEADSTIHDSISEIRQLDEKLDKNKLLVDSVDGKANELVYQAKSGLRLEWSTKTGNTKVGPNNVALVNYKVRVAGGEEYDNNDKIGFPVPLKPGIGMIVEGWDLGLQEMAAGDVGRILIPNALAYGEEGYSTIVPPNADLIVDIEIIEVIEGIDVGEGVKVYKWTEVEEGKTPKKNDEILFDYFAYFKGEDASMYDNSFQNGEPFSFKYKNASVIDGLHLGMSVMKKGENAFIDIPADQAYGSKGLIDLVPANRDIVYDVRISDLK